MINRIPFINLIKKRTDKTLRSKPNQWSLRLPWVMFFVLLAHAVIAFFVVVTEWDVRKYMNEEVWYGFLSVLVLLGTVFYCIYLFRFNVFKRFGQLPRFYFLRTFLGFFLVFSLISTCFLTPAWVTTIMARAQNNDAKVAKDINRINTLITTLEKDSLPHYWTRHKVELLLVEDELPENVNDYKHSLEYEGYKFYNNHLNEHGGVYSLDYMGDQEKNLEMAKAEQLGYFDYPKVSYLDTSDFREALLSDSIVVINDTQFYSFKCPDYIRLNNVGQFFYHANVEEITNKQLFYNVIADSTPVDMKAVRDELTMLIQTYSTKAKVSRYENYGEYDIIKAPNAQSDDFGLSRLASSLQNISKKYYYWDFGEWFKSLTVIYYVALVLGLFLFLFRHNRIKDYFLSILAGVVLAIITGVSMAMSYGAEAEVLAVLLSLYVLIAIVLASKIFKVKRNRLSYKIGMNLLIFITPFIPFLAGAFYYYLKHKNFERNYGGMKDRDYYRELYSKAFYLEDIMIIFNQAIGIVLLLVLIHLVYSKMLKRSYSLPQL